MTAESARGLALDDLLTLEPLAGEANRFVGPGRDYGPLRMYGGHLLGQSLAAAFATIDTDKHAHACSAQFLRAGEPGVPIRYAVESLRDSRAYATRAIRALQGDNVLLHMVASFKVDERGDEHAPPMPEVPDAAAVIAAREAVGRERFPFPFVHGLDIDLEIVDGWNPRDSKLGAPAIQAWMRAGARDGRSTAMQQCILAFLSDSTLMFNALRPYGGAGRTHRSTSLDHHVWFHRVPDASQWLLFDQQSTVAADSRGFNRGTVFDAHGGVIATVAQESMLRRL